MADFEDVTDLLDSDLNNFENELDELYRRMEEFNKYAEAWETAQNEENAEYFRELAVDTYESFEMAIQLKKEPEESIQEVLGYE